MAKYCPAKDGPALYLECLECDNKLCEKTQIKKVKMDKQTSIENNKKEGEWDKTQN